ncbi:MAG: alpha-L-fucosidase [Planctomycetaceae bacterium]|nr:alpha-L-fucosidase [Planctomycetaceae bacterium]
MAKEVKESPAVVADRKRRMKWWNDARLGMFIHYGLYSQLGRGEWVMNRERIPAEQYQKLADTFAPKPRCPREWAALAKKAGMKYMVMTTKHHEGFCLWDSAQTDFNSMQRGPRRDIVREYVDACREYGLKIGFYYSLMDWHHPDGANCYHDAAAGRRFLDFTQGCVRELMSNYGKVDILWYDLAWPFGSAAAWEADKMNAIARRLQPHIIINNRSYAPEDFGTPEGHVTAEAVGRAWESCMIVNSGWWGYVPLPADEWLTPQAILRLLNQAVAGAGNLLINIGPMADGSVPPEAADRLTKLGKWLGVYGEAVYGKLDRVERMDGLSCGFWSRRGNTMYAWITRWPGRELAIGGLKTKVKAATLVGSNKKLAFTQTADRLVIGPLPAKCPDRWCNTALIKLDFAGKPAQFLGAGLVDIGV